MILEGERGEISVDENEKCLERHYALRAFLIGESKRACVMVPDNHEFPNSKSADARPSHSVRRGLALLPLLYCACKHFAAECNFVVTVEYLEGSR